MSILALERSPLVSDYPHIGSDVVFARKARRNLDWALSSGLDEFKSTAVRARFEPNTEEWLVHPRVNVYVDCTTSCEYDCGFCIAKTTDGRCNSLYLDPDDLVRNLKVLDSAGIDYSLQLTGGEPLRHPMVDTLLEILSSQGRKLVVNTNLGEFTGALLLADHVNISCHHYNEQLDEKVFNGKRDHKQLRASIQNGLADKVRLNCNLIGGYIDTYGEIMQYVAFAYWYMGARNISFSWLSALPADTMYDQSIIDFVVDRPVPPMGDLLKKLDETTHWRFLKYRGGVACYYEIWEYTAYVEPVTVQFKYSDNKYLDMIDKAPRLIPDIVMHPDGSMTGSWDTRRKKLA